MNKKKTWAFQIFGFVFRTGANGETEMGNGVFRPCNTGLLCLLGFVTVVASSRPPTGKHRGGSAIGPDKMEFNPLLSHLNAPY